MVPSENERWRIRSITAPPAREATILQFIIERRSLYEQQFQARCRAANVDTPHVRNQMSDERLRPFIPIINEAIAATADQRADSDRRAWEMREATRIRDAQSRGERVPTNEEYQYNQEQKRKRRRSR